VLGGYHPTLMPDEAMQHCDAVVVGEAEPVWAQLIEDFRNDRLQRRYPAEGIGRCASGEQIAKPRRDLLDSSRYTGFNSVQATRGCTHNCAFCSVRAFHEGFSKRPVPSVVQEIRELVQETRRRDILVRFHLTKPHISFVDDNITADRKYALELFDAIAPLGITWDTQAESGMGLDRELLEAAARSGCIWVSVGFETASPHSRQFLHKLRGRGLDGRLEDQFEEEVKRFHAHGINVLGNFIFGLAFAGQETQDTVEVFDRTLDLTADIGLDAVLFHVLTPYPGTRMRKRLEQENRVMTNEWEHYNCSEVVSIPDKMTPEDLQRGLFHAYSQFYSFWRGIRRAFVPRRGIVSRLAMHFSMRRKLKRVCAKHISASAPWTEDLRKHWNDYLRRVGERT